MRLLILLIGWLVCLAAAHAQDSDPLCPSDLPPRLQAGVWGQVVVDSPVNQRADRELSAQKIGQIPARDIFRVLDEPKCADGYRWWPVYYDRRTGWAAEGDARTGEYWLDVLPGSPPPAELDPNDPPGCLAPPENYEQVILNGYARLNLRTLAMLDHAQARYTEGGGIVRFRDAVVQGSYNPGVVQASFGTHDGGGAVDISVREPITQIILLQEIQPMIDALRLAGFAAWLRDAGELYPGSPIHIHAIAIGDAELSDAARAQINGAYGYLRGYNGLPEGYGGPALDTSGAMVICAWMRALGFDDLRAVAVWDTVSLPS
jgi:hypothetical protein